jgi:hypothetical protein
MMRGWVWIGVLLGVCALAFGQQKVDVEKVQARYRQLTGAVSEARLAETVRWMAAQGSRVAGYPGADRAADYIEQQFRAVGLQNVRREAFPITVPVDEEAHLHLNGQKLRVYPLWPNQVRTSQLPPDGIRGNLIYVRDGQLQQFRGKPVEGSIVLMDFNTGNNWLNAARLGARAIVFIEPETTDRGEAEAKFIGIPLDVPRFWLPRQHAAKLIALAETQPDLQAKLTCRMPWQVREGYNIVGVLPGSDPALKDQWIVVTAYYDSISIVPSLAPGRGQRGGHRQPAGVGAGVSAVSAQAQRAIRRAERALPSVGGRAPVHRGAPARLEPTECVRIAWRTPPAKQDIYLFVGLDLATRSTGVGVFYKSWFYDMREDIQRYFTDIGRVMREHAERIAPVLGTTPDKLFADGINAVQGRYWRTYIPGKPAFDAEAATLAGAWGITFATIEDSRPLVDTPFDTFENCNIANLAIQTRVIACQLDHVFNDPNQRGDFALRFPIEKPSEWLRIRLQGGFGRLYGNVYLFDPNRSFYPNTPVNGSIVVVRHWMKNLMGVRGNMFQIVDDSSPIPREQARFNFVGIPPITAYNYRREFEINAYKLNPDTGAIEYAPDLGIQGAENYPINILMTVGEKETPIIVFRCVATALYDLIDPQTLAPLTTLELFDGDTNARPRMFGLITTPKDVPLASYVEDVAVIFSQPGARLKIKMGAGPGADRMLLLNSTPDNPEGKGYLVGGDPREAQGFTVPTFDPKTLTERDLIARGGAIAYTALRVAEDMFTLNDYRIRTLAKHRIVNPGVNDLHALAKESLEKAQKALQEKDYAALDVYARMSWGYSARAYPDVKATANDVVNGVIFYLALLMPFAYFMERLLFGAPNLKSQLTYASLIFVAVFLLFRYIHPAFDITGNPVIVFIAFTMGALSVIVGVFIAGKFEEQLKRLQKQVIGSHTADVGRMSVAAAAFNLGVSNMRRRPLRTFLTSLSLVLVTFIVLSFTSIVNVLRFNEAPAPGAPRYNGIMMRTVDWQPLRESAYRLMNDEFGRERAVAPRAWFFGTQIGEQAFITLQRADRRFSARAIVGMTPAEAKVTRPQEALVAGRWLLPGERNAIILPQNAADALGIRPEEVGRARIQFAGVDYTVVGIWDNLAFKQITDLDTEPLTPVDFILMQRLQSQGRQGGQGGFREYVHLEPDSVVIMPYETVINLGGNIYSLALEFATQEEALRILRSELMPRLGLNLYAGLGDRIVRYSTIQATSGQGLEYVILPIIIAALIVLNTMLGSVYERVREIGIFSAIGLAPNHVAMLFFAESLVYAVLGSVAGYFVAQLVAKIIVLTGWFPQLYLNFSSMSAVFSTVVVVAVVLLSTIYPARKASEVATPAEERTWRLPEPDGDTWRIPLPFSVTSVQARGLSGFIAEWFHAYEEHSVGEFITQDVRTETFAAEHGTGYRIECDAWIAPFDLGVSQHVRIEIVPTAYAGVYDIRLTLTRLSGDIANWKRVNRRFLNILRKQFLIWRTLPQDQRERYLKQEELVGV